MPTLTTTFDAMNPLKPVWTDPGCFATTLFIAFIDTYVDDKHPLKEVLSWHPYTVQMQIEEDFGVDLPAASYGRLMAAIDLLTSNNFTTSLPDFIHTCTVLSGDYVQPGHLVLADSADCAWGLTEGMLLVPPDPQEKEPFSEEIRGYIGKVLGEEGILNPPDVLRIALRDNDLASRARYNFSDDPVMFGAINDMEKSKTDAINHLVQGRLRALFNQVAALRLKQAEGEQVKALVAKILKNLPGEEDLPLPA